MTEEEVAEALQRFREQILSAARVPLQAPPSLPRRYFDPAEIGFTTDMDGDW